MSPPIASWLLSATSGAHRGTSPLKPAPRCSALVEGRSLPPHRSPRLFEAGDRNLDPTSSFFLDQPFSPRFRRYAEELSDRLITTYYLHQKDIVEFGGGRGDFLRIICDRGNNNGVSFGPSYRPAAGDGAPVNVRFVTDYYTAKYAAAPANLIVCRHVLEHFWEPRSLIDTVRQAVGDRKDLVVYFEVT